MSHLRPRTLIVRAFAVALGALPGLIVFGVTSLYSVGRASLLAAALGALVASIPQALVLRWSTVRTRLWVLSLVVAWMAWAVGVALVVWPFARFLTNTSSWAQLASLSIPAALVGGLATSGVQAQRFAPGTGLRWTWVRGMTIGHLLTGLTAAAFTRGGLVWEGLFVAALVLGLSFAVTLARVEARHAAAVR